MAENHQGSGKGGLPIEATNSSSILGRAMRLADWRLGRLWHSGRRRLYASGARRRSRGSRLIYPANGRPIMPPSPSSRQAVWRT